MAHILLEKTDHLSDTIFRYQKGKHVMATPSQLVLRSDFDFDAGKREKILQTWNDQAASQNVQVRYRSEVTAISGAPGAFTLKLADGDSINAQAVSTPAIMPTPPMRGVGATCSERSLGTS